MYRSSHVHLKCPFECTGEDSLVHVSRDALPGDAFAFSMSKVWEVIKSQKDLNLPAHKVSSTTVLR